MFHDHINNYIIYNNFSLETHFKHITKLFLSVFGEVDCKFWDLINSFQKIYNSHDHIKKLDDNHYGTLLLLPKLNSYEKGELIIYNNENLHL